MVSSLTEMTKGQCKLHTFVLHDCLGLDDPILAQPKTSATHSLVSNLAATASAFRSPLSSNTVQTSSISI